MFGSTYGDLDEVQIAAITSGFANNTTLRDLKFNCWREADLIPVLTALQDHIRLCGLRKIHLTAAPPDYLLSLSRLDLLLRNY
jgi:hypothetical protein